MYSARWMYLCARAGVIIGKRSSAIYVCMGTTLIQILQGR